jgi:pyruvate dehydrogenase E2 component (dihydrolipoamide acetyltransferase)
VAIEVKLPQLAASMADGIISKWLKQVGDAVKRGEPLFEVESDKVTTEVESPVDGILHEIVVGEGKRVDVGVVLAVIGSADDAIPAASGAAAVAATTPILAAIAASPTPSVEAPAAEKIFITPRARKSADELGVDINRVKGTGPGGRILERDIQAFVPAVAVAPPQVPATAAAPPPVPATTAAPARAAGPVPESGTLLPLVGMRRTIADRMVHSQRTVAGVTLTAEVDVAEVVKLRDQVSGEWERQHGFKLSYTEVIVKAVARSLREHPNLNSSLTDEGIRLHSEVNVGIGVAVDDGLIVPVVRNADQKSLVEIAQAVRDVSDRARKGQLSRDDVGEGTFTISNMGMLGVESFTPIINWPECAILGVGRIAERAVVRDGQIVARPTMWLSLTFDHRIVDGAPAAKFLARIRQLLESPYLLFV